MIHLVDFDSLSPDQLAASFDDPARYCENFLGEYVTVDCALDPTSPWEYANAPLLQQRRIMRDVAALPAVSVAGSNTWGKSHIMVRLGSWWFDKWDECLIVIIAPRMDQINKNFAVPFADMRGGFSEFPDKDNVFVYMPDAGNPKKQIVYTTAAKQESIAGWHYFDNKLFMFDEASGIHNDIYDAVFPMATRRDSKWVLFGNPLRDLDQENYGRFYETGNSPNWKFYSLSAYDHPNYIHKQYVIERGMDPDFPEKAAIQYGKGSVEFLARVEGKFATVLAESLYAQWIDHVFVLEEDWQVRSYRHRALGIDPAGKASGDSTVINDYRYDRRRGDAAETVYENEHATEDDILEVLREETSDGSVDAIGVDVRGLGHYLPALIRKDDDILVDHVYEYDGARSANDKDRYDSKKDEDAFDLEDRMKQSVLMVGSRAHAMRIKKDETLYREMGTRKYGTHKNRRKLENKKRGTGASPDHFEALLTARDAMKRFLRWRATDNRTKIGMSMGQGADFIPEGIGI